MPSRRRRLAPALCAVFAVFVIIVVALSHGGRSTPAATPGNPTSSVTPRLPSSATVPPQFLPGAEPPGVVSALQPRPSPIGTRDPVVHFSGTPVDLRLVLPTMPPPPERTPVPSTFHDAPGQARPSGDYHTPTPAQ